MQVLLEYRDEQARRDRPGLAERLGLRELADLEPPPAGTTHLLTVAADGLALRALAQPKAGATRVDFEDPALLHRLRTSGRNAGLGKALGLGKRPDLKVLDATAGLGRDALLMAHLGCEVLMLERSSLIHALLEDGMQRAQSSALPFIRRALPRMRLLHMEARDCLDQIVAGGRERPDVIYLDPMFPPRGKSASVKKDIALLQQVLGPEADFASLLEKAREAAAMRVVVKRPGGKQDGDLPEPSFTTGGRTAHYEVYVSSSFSSMR